MRASNLLGAATAVLLTGTMLGGVPAATAKGDNQRKDWDDRRVAQTSGSPDGSVHVLGNRRDMTTVVRELGVDSDTWLIRESRPDGGLRFYPRLEGQRQVQRFRFDQSGTHGTTYATYEASGRLRAVEADATRAFNLMLRKDLAAAGADEPKIVAGESSPDNALITQGGTWHQHFGPVGGANPATTPNDGGDYSRWVSYPDPNVDGVPGNEGESYAFVDTGHLMVFWNAPNGDLKVARRVAHNREAGFEPAQTITTGGEKMVDFTRATGGANGNVLITQAVDGTISTWGYSNGVWFPGSSHTQLPGTAGVTEVPEVLVDSLGTLTIAFREPIDNGGLMLWQENRPRGSFLEQPVMVPGTRGADTRVVMSPRGTITVGLRSSGEANLVRVKHLPAGKTKWTTGVRLISPKLDAAATGWDLGNPERQGDMRLAVNDRAGVYGFRYDAPRPITKMTKPVLQTQRDRSYRVTANTTWAYGERWEMRARLDKGKRYGKWKPVNLDDGARSKEVIRPRGERRCYQARADTKDGGSTRWSTQRCVTVRR
ncbi:MAG: hypothetical protein WBQ50_04865 [Nocardioides sp.]